MTKYRPQARQRRELTSLGMDVGTTTTCLVLSRLTTTASMETALPRVEIVERRVVHRSPVRLTPFADGRERLDSQSLRQWVEAELAGAGVRPEAVDSGAIIVTGEAAACANAPDLAAELAGEVGRFVVATAGPALEGILAGRGAGAAHHSRRYPRGVVNLDIGGGTTNGALFRHGQAVLTVAAHVGGRLVRLDPTGARIEGVSAPAVRVARDLGIQLTPDRPADLAELTAVCRVMAGVLDTLLEGSTPSGLAAGLLIGPPLPGPVAADVITFSGGVGREVYAGGLPRTLAEVARYGDIGPLLAAVLRESAMVRRYRLEPPAETLYATVIGAGMEMTELSGSTIHLSAGALLPLRNLPVVRPPMNGAPQTADQVAAAVATALEWMAAPGRGAPHQPIAVILPHLGSPRYEQVEEIARGMAAGLAPLVRAGLPVVVVQEGNVGKAIGQALAPCLPPGYPLICIDQVQVETGDFIDIGEPVFDGAAVPVAVKTLVFGS